MSLEVAGLRALAHPVRLRILSLLTGAELCAAEIARELGITQANASYHLRRLADVGEVVECGTRSVRGGVAKLYRHPWQAPREPTLTDAADRAAMVEAMAAELVRRYYSVGQPAQQVLVDAELWVTPDEWQSAQAAMATASTALHSAAKAPRTEGTIKVNMTAALFRMRDDSQR